ncbi:hypothetical protein V6N12_009779 [Hibiscus sabdariffa]|uniref:Uncharacterized protein n=1 Tax=Hibiscus sabdariffa TaxID=183260 RepID=A0ABR2EC72_9ROSI
MVSVLFRALWLSVKAGRNENGSGLDVIAGGEQLEPVQSAPDADDVAITTQCSPMFKEENRVINVPSQCGLKYDSSSAT